MEKSILRTLNFDINIPIPYRFLRRFAKVGAPLPSCHPPRGAQAALGGGGGWQNPAVGFWECGVGIPCPKKIKRGRGGGSGVVPHKKKIFLAAVCPCQHGDADAGPLPLRDDPAGVRLRPGAPLQAGRQLPAAGAHHEEPGWLGEPPGRRGGRGGGDAAFEEPPPAHPVSFWQTPTLEYYSGYRAQDLHPLVKRLNFLLTYQPCDKLKAVRTKYSHR